MAKVEIKKINLELVLVIVSILGATIPLYIHSSHQMQTMHADVRADIKAVQEEMKDFHGRLCAIEERRRGEQ